MTDELRLLWAILSGPRGFLALDSPHARHFVSVGKPRNFSWVCERDGYRGDLKVNTVPMLEESYRHFADPQCLWVRTETGRAQQLLGRFRPRPTLVVREGDSVRCVALWALSESLSTEPRWMRYGRGHSWLEEANRRLAHELDCPKKHASPWFAFNPPGAILREGRKQPALHHVVYRSEGLYQPRQVVGHLAPAPDPKAWLQRDAA